MLNKFIVDFIFTSCKILFILSAAAPSILPIEFRDQPILVE